MNDYTHICIENGKLDERIDPKSFILKKGDYATLVWSGEDKDIKGGIACKFKEDDKHTYGIYLFLPLPPPMVKTVYVSVSQEVVKELPEPVLN